MTHLFSRPLLRKATLAGGLALIAGLAFAAEEAKDPVVKKRIELMRTLKSDTGLLNDMASGKRPFDPAVAEEAAAAILANADLVEPDFESEADDPASTALPDIWMAPAEFRQKANRLYKAAMELSPGSAKGLAGSLNAVNAACKDCHGRFKM